MCQYRQESNTIDCHSVAILTTNQVVNDIPNNLCIYLGVCVAYTLEVVHPLPAECQVPFEDCDIKSATDTKFQGSLELTSIYDFVHNLSKDLFQ